jgi:UDP-glucose 4-epimerase
MTSLVTGGAGFIGSNLVRALLDRGDRVIVVDDFSTGRRENLPRSSNLTVIESDLAQGADVGEAVEKADYVFHLAAQVGTLKATQDPRGDALANVIGTIRLLEACRDAPVRRIVVATSAAAFGEAQTVPIAEDHPQRPESFYALSKMAAERYAVLAATLLHLPTVCLRYFNVYGFPVARSEYASVIVAFLDRLRANQPLLIHGDGLQDRDFVYVRDVVAANLLAAERGRPGAVYNIGTGTATTVLDLARLMCELAGRQPGIDFLPPRAGEVRHSVAGIERARAELGYEPAYDLRAGLRDFWDRAWTEPLEEQA